MDTRSGVALAVAGLVVLAGCSGLPGGSSGGADTPTLTPVPMPEETDTPPADGAAGSPAPGVSLDGTVNVSRLVAAHEAYLETRTYQWVLRYGLSSGRPDSLSGNFTRHVTVGEDAFLVEHVNHGLAANLSLYVTDGQGYLRTVRANYPRYDRLDDVRSHYSYALAAELLRRHVAGFSFNVTVVERGGRTFYRLHTAGTDVAEPLADLDRTVSNYTATAYVTSDGFVRTLVVDYDQGRGDDVEHVSIRYDYTDVGSTTLDRPEWVSQVPTDIPVITLTPTPTGKTATEGPPAEGEPPSTTVPATDTPVWRTPETSRPTQTARPTEPLTEVATGPGTTANGTQPGR